MKKYILLIFAAITASTGFSQDMKTLHDFTAETIEGEQLDLSKFKGKKLMVVNTASKCGLTPQYEDLQKLYEEFGGDGFEIIGFPANNFMKQEPGSDEKIAEFCSKNYGVSFTMMSKIDVKGKDIHPIYQWLTAKDQNGVEDNKVGWNFQKYLIDEDGKFVRMISPKEKPYNDSVIAWIKGK
ncbi:MAG: glutathione peroxidase [Bacteroidia bacterium]|jgi:glutathione peroxidase